VDIRKQQARVGKIPSKEIAGDRIGRESIYIYFLRVGATAYWKR
jgi:hypothetical protein